ncbi:Choline-sulfatase [Tsuneonella dongtanensis]|uniref:Choline-sulfatase n=1 Tax=Tsuneonella dongtanensis TaxID=692370 RepID=A0A1B2AAZ9_9SPHN|nr:sulfatase [Tsuneonella dongtanensis]ANY19340.1 Choline-sulfatase [Tsuneonella dongtanensis]
MTTIRAAWGATLLALTALAQPAIAQEDDDAVPAGERGQPIPGKPDRPQTGKPNFLFIAVDDLNDWVKPFEPGHPDTITPNFARLAAKGVRFDNAQTAATVCNPSRIALLTGVHPSRTGIYGNNQQPLRKYMPNRKTLFEHFDDAGYHVAGTGKLFHNPDNVHQRWDQYFKAGGHPKPAADKLPLNGLPKLTKFLPAFDWGPVDAPASDFMEYKMSSFGIDFLQKDHDAPFVLAIGYQLPHLTWYMPRANWDRINANPALPPYLKTDKDDLTGWAANHGTREQEIITENGEAKWHEAIRAYLASINFVDDQLGRLLDALETSKYADNTVIVLWSDHGWHLGEKDAWRKVTLWERSGRIPMVIALPGKQDDGKRFGQPVSLLDIFPTMDALAGLPDPQDIYGKSLVPVLENADTAKLEREYVLTSMDFGSSLRGDRWRYTFYKDGSEELYDEKADPNEWKNLIADPAYAKVAAQFRAATKDFSAREPLKPAQAQGAAGDGAGAGGRKGRKPVSPEELERRKKAREERRRSAPPVEAGERRGDY